VGIDDMKRLFEVAKDCRIVLSGDTGQHASVARGDALRILEQHSNLASGQLTRIRRQHCAEYRHAVELAAQKRTTESFAQLERMGAVVELSGNQIYDSAAQSYLKSRKQNKSSLLVAPTWAEIEAVTEKVRAELKSSGVLGGEEKEFRVFDSLSWTEAQKRDVRQYRAGQVLNFHRTTHGFSKGESAEVVQVSDDSLKLRRPDGSETSVQLGRGSAAFDVGEARTLKIAAGDKLLLQANWRKKIINGELVEAKSVQGDSILLADGRIIPSDYRTFTHGYAVTSHAAQGKTVDEVLVVASSRSLAAINQQQFYVSISRGRERCQVFTDDKDLLRSHVTHPNARVAAVEVVPGAAMKRHKFIRQILQWSERVRELMRLNPVKQQHTEVIHERRGIRI
jgi:ATP-dependent exoDNAse (exonuclease V) alpha subunit